MIKSRSMRWAEHVACMGMRNAYKILVGKPERRPLIRPRHGRKNNIKMGSMEIGCALDYCDSG
jgi:hypothetical protein